MAKLVFSYSHADELLRNELEKHLSPLKRQGLIETWHDRRIVAGEDFSGQINDKFEAADVVLLLVSPDFIASDYCYEIEMRRSLERHEQGEAFVIPVILRPCDWHGLPFGKLLAATKDGKPVTRFPTLDDGFFEVVQSIKTAVAKLKGHSVSTAIMNPGVAATNNSASTSTSAPRSSNLRIKQSFTDRDRDIARREGFEFIAGFFDNSLSELKDRNHGIETGLLRIDANSFEATIYVNGKRTCHCGIWIENGAGMPGDICFNHSGVARNSYNESLSLQDDGYVLGFRPLGMAFSGREREQLLTGEGAAEYLWRFFIRALQNG